MKQFTYITSALLFSIFLASCTNGQNKVAEGSIAENVNVETFEKHITSAQVVDVRTPQEWNKGIIEGAVKANFYEKDFKVQLEKLDKEKPVAVYCAVGGRSGQAMSMMQEMGFKEVYNLKGGMDAWKGAEKSTVKP